MSDSFDRGPTGPCLSTSSAPRKICASKRWRNDSFKSVHNRSSLDFYGKNKSRVIRSARVSDDNGFPCCQAFNSWKIRSNLIGLDRTPMRAGLTRNGTPCRHLDRNFGVLRTRIHASRVSPNSHRNGNTSCYLLATRSSKRNHFGG